MQMRRAGRSALLVPQGDGALKGAHATPECVPMRALILLLLCLGFGAAASAQQRHVAFVLDDGLRIEGPVLEFDQKRIVVEVGGEPRAYDASRIRECRFRMVDDGADAPSPVPHAETRTDAAAGSANMRTVARRPLPLEADLAAIDRARMSPFRQRTEELRVRYPWLVPSAGYQWVSLIVTLFAFMSLFSHFAARLSGADQPSFGRAMGLAFVLLLVPVVALAGIPQQGRALALAGASFALLVPLLHRVGYRLSMPGAALATSLFFLQLGLGYAALRLIDTMLRSMGVAAA
jgi:hypothetical protein